MYFVLHGPPVGWEDYVGGQGHKTTGDFGVSPQLSAMFLEN